MKEQHGKDAQLIAISYTSAESETPDIRQVVSNEMSTVAKVSGDMSEPVLKKRKVDLGTTFWNLVDEQNTDVSLSECELHYLKRLVALSRGVRWKDVFGVLRSLPTETIFNDSHVQNCFGGKGFRPQENIIAMCNDYKKFESMVALAIFCASPRNGVQGISFDDFFSGLLGEFQDEFEPRTMTLEDREIVVSELLIRIAVEEKLAQAGCECDETTHLTGSISNELEPV